MRSILSLNIKKTGDTTFILSFMVRVRESFVNYRGPGFLAVVWFVSLPPPFSRQKVGPWTLDIGRLRKRDNLLTGEGEGAKSCDGEKAWSSINHSIISGYSDRSKSNVAGSGWDPSSARPGLSTSPAMRSAFLINSQYINVVLILCECLARKL
jgi:hypothetical protein